MTEILKVNKNFVEVKVNGRKFKIENENVEEQLAFMEKVVPPPKNVFSFAKIGQDIPFITN